MKIRCGLLSLLLCCFWSLSFAQDSIPIGTPLDSLSDQVENVDEDFMQEGYYDHVPKLSQVPTVDTGLFSRLTEAYQKDEFDYDRETIEQVGLFKRIFNRISQWLGNLFPDADFFHFSDFFYKILAVLAIVVLVWIVYRIVFSGRRLLSPDKEKNGDAEEIKFVEKNLLEVDITRYVEQAKKDADFALAIRYLNLLNIQLLAKKDLIQWRYSKSHVELIDELADVEIKKEFSRNVNIFNRVWYGDSYVDEAKYEEYARYFLNFQAKWQ